MAIYRRSPKRDWKKWLDKVVETAIKLFLLLLLPLPAAAFACGIWYVAFFRNNLHFHDDLADNVILSWISIFGILYSLLAAVIIGAVFEEYKKIRMAIKCRDMATFMSLRDEDISPIIHSIMTVLALGVLATFMGLTYPDALSGIGVIGATTYIFALLYWVIREVDDPFSGLWFIKHVPDGWLDEDPKEWRNTHYAKLVATTNDGTTETTLTITETEAPSAVAAVAPAPEEEKAA